ncbi:hypothetical protein BGZ61DRAFT_544879 [Ilyonectria robusta]|uniref:uncharacterized protein n=1 Tax=Ilyonectria robusta TaxID=1079257 RepID=UPI001E8DB26C|nr:uncharacterized protein BGZ61DRAFT_544879 [Ilyonectria robusta]KAH8738418.1 hypothetical protein BGZ61DRAFT_544879 [Ilyonectria robusta]
MVEISEYHKYDYHGHVPNKGKLMISHQVPTGNLDAPFFGITDNGIKREGLYRLQDEGAPTGDMAARNVLQSLNADEKGNALRDLNSEDWRKGSNPEIILFRCGVRLEHLDKGKVELILELLKKSLSEAGFSKVTAAMKTNKFLGEICGKEAILNENSYWFTLFGKPSETESWGYMFFGHHLGLNVFVNRQQMVIGPIIDTGPDKGIELCEKEGQLGLYLMQSLSPELQQKAQIYSHMHDQAMPEGRWNPADERHMAGAFQDNRVIAYEGILATDMTAEQQTVLISIISAFLALLPPKPLQFRLNQIVGFFSETYFSWIGGFGPADAFYYRIQSPVALFEFDHHSGVFLTNDEPAKYHIHTIQRLPNGNDYGRELRKLALVRETN